MSAYSTRGHVLDPNLTLITLRARAHPEAHYLRVRAWEARRRRRRECWNAALGLGLTLVAIALWWLAAALLA